MGLNEDEQARATGYVEGFNAADAREASAMALGRQQTAEDAIEGERIWKIRGGYRQLPEFLAANVCKAGGGIEFGASVVAIEVHAGGGFYVWGADGRRWPAQNVIVALPLGVIQDGTVRLPAAAEPARRAASRRRMGPVCRFTFVFNRRLWPEPMSFLQAPDGKPAVWWSDRPASERMLTGWTGGPRALDLLALSPAALRQMAAASFAKALGLPGDEVTSAVEEFHFFDWQADPLSRGAYSWVPVGELDASANLSRPIRLASGATLHFAGEHTDTAGLWGTVHAAYASGLRAGRAVRASGSYT